MNPTRFEMEQPQQSCIWHEDGAVVAGQTLLDIADEGAGKYALLSCSNIAFDNLDEFDEWVGKVRGAIAVGLGGQS